MKDEGSSRPVSFELSRFSFSKPTASYFLLLAISVGLSAFGCKARLEVSDQAKPTQTLTHDPAENDLDSLRWPQWRGRNGSGIAPAGSPPIHFSDQEGYRWKIRLPGTGNSSPVVWDDSILLTVELGKSDRPNLAIVCIDRRDGHLLWMREAGEARGQTHVKNGFASASVATDGRRIFVSYGCLGLFAYDFSGKQLWSVDFDQKDHIWGVASSPVLYGDSVIQLYDFDGPSFIAAYDKATGRQLWQTPRASTGGWSTPVFIDTTVDGQTRTEMIVQGGAGLCQVVAYDPRDGHEFWHTGETKELVTPLPLLCNGIVYCASGRNGPILAVRPGGSGDVSATHMVWKTSRGGPYIPSGVCYRNRLYLIGDGGPLACYDVGNGRLVWETRLAGPFTSSLVAADGRIYAVNERGVVSVFAAGDQFELLATNNLHEACLATPAIVGNELILRTKNHLYCFANDKTPPPEVSTAPKQSTTSLPSQSSEQTSKAVDDRVAKSPQDAWPVFRGNAEATGVAEGPLTEQPELLWTFATEKGGFEATAAIVEGVVYIGSTGGTFYAIDLASGKPRWQFETSSGFTASPAVQNGRILVGDIDGTFHGIDAASGKQIWEFSTDGEIDSSANCFDNRVLFGSQDGFLYCLDATSGNLVWKFEGKDQIRCFPSILDKQGFVAGCDGHLHMIDLEQGKELNATKINSPTGCSPALLGGCVFVGTEGHEFYAIDPKQQKILWKYENPDHGAAFRSSAAVTHEIVLVGSRDKQLHALDPNTGKQRWAFTAQGRIDSSPVIVGPRAFFGSTDGRLHAVDLATGQSAWQFELGGSVLASPAIANGRLIIGNDAGQLYCFGEKQHE